MGVTLNRHLGEPDTMIAGQYTLRTESGRALLSCPLCGHHFELPSACRVEPDGRAVPAVHCPRCCFFEYCSLESHWEDYP
jgi:hypothetical protein